MKKRFDMKLVEIQKDISSIDLERQQDRLILKLENDMIFDGNSNNIIQSMTLNELTKRLKTVANTTLNLCSHLN